MSNRINSQLNSDAKAARAFESLDTQFVRHDPSKPTSTKPTGNYERQEVGRHLGTAREGTNASGRRCSTRF